MSDAHTGASSQLPIALSQMQQIDSDGDLTDRGAAGEWDDHLNLVSTIFDATATTFDTPKPRYLGVVGNHDLMNYSDWNTQWNSHLTGQAGLGQTGPGGVYYSLGFLNSLFVVMDSQHVTAPSCADPQTQALASALQGSTATFKFLFFHTPVYPCFADAGHGPFSAGLPWVDLAEQNDVDVIFSGHTHVYSRTCKMRGGACTGDGTGLTHVETGPVGTSNTRPINVGTNTVSGTDSMGLPRADTYNCTANLEGSLSMANDFCHVEVDDCRATVDCYLVGPGSASPFDTWVIDHCAK